MFGSNGDDDHGPDWNDYASLLFGYLVYREVRDGRLDLERVTVAGCRLLAIILLVGGAFAVLLWLPSLFYGGGRGALVVPTGTLRPTPTATVRPTPTPMATPTPRPTPTPTPTPIPVAKIGQTVMTDDGWAIRVRKVERWRPSWYDEPGWRLITVYVTVGMPAAEDGCIFPDSFYVEATDGETYQGWIDFQHRMPHLFECTDYHRPTTTNGWVTFEVRDKHAKGLLLTVSRFGGGNTLKPIRIT